MVDGSGWGTLPPEGDSFAAKGVFWWQMRVYFCGGGGVLATEWYYLGQLAIFTVEGVFSRQNFSFCSGRVIYGRVGIFAYFLL